MAKIIKTKPDTIVSCGHRRGIFDMKDRTMDEHADFIRWKYNFSDRVCFKCFRRGLR